MSLSKSISNTAEFSVRCFKPQYAENYEEYDPWFFGHEEQSRISDEVLTEMFEKWKMSGGLENCDGSPANGFANFLEEQGYIVFHTPESYCWTLPVTLEEEQKCVDRCLNANNASGKI